MAIALYTPKPITKKNKNTPEYHFKQGAISPLIGRAYLLDYNLFTGKLTDFAKTRLADSLLRTYKDLH